MEKEKNLQPDGTQNSSDGRTEEMAQQEVTPEDLSAMESLVTETDDTGSDSGEATPSQSLEEEQVPQNGQSAVAAATAEVQPASEELQDRFLRLAADFANYKRRNEQERVDFADYIRREFARALLPILDDFDLMMEYDSEHPERLVEGARIIRQKMFELLSKQGMEKIEALSQPFDYERHEAILAQPVKDKALDHVVLSVMQDGYLFKDKVLRPSKVIVGQYNEEQESPSPADESGQTNAGDREPEGAKEV